MQQLYCLSCEHSWVGKKEDDCPHCPTGIVEVVDDEVDDYHGNFEGDFKTIYPYGEDRGD